MSQSPGCRQEIFIIGKYAHKKEKKEKNDCAMCEGKGAGQNKCS